MARNRPTFARRPIRVAGGVIAVLLAPWTACADWPSLTVRAASIEVDGSRLQGFSGRLEASGAFTLFAERATIGGLELAGPDLEIRGQLSEFTRQGDDLRLAGRADTRWARGEFDLQESPESLRASLQLDDMGPAELQRRLGPLEKLAWVSDVTLSLRTDWEQKAGEVGELRAALSVRDLAFDSPDGRYAAAGLALEMETAIRDFESAVRITGRLTAGELLVDQFYRDFSDGGLEFGLESPSPGDLDSVSFRAADDGTLSLAGRAALNANRSLHSLWIDHLELAFPGAYTRYLEAPAAQWTLSGLELTGRLAWQGEWSAGVLRSGDLRLEDLSVVDTTQGRFAVTGLAADLRPGDHAFRSKLVWRGLLLGRVNLGAGEAWLDSRPDGVALEQPLVLKVLGGELRLQELNLGLPGEGRAEPEIALRADLEAVDMEQLTRAFGWPVFGGVVSGRIPGVRLDGGVIRLDGEIQVDVFDGTLQLRDLAIERPFGVLPSLAADIDFENLDLEALTRTFSFGRISGRLDGYVHDLRMLDWRPVAFDAWLGTPEQQKGANDISRRAVSNLTTLGGGSATAALANPLLRMFGNFSYRRLGIGCRLQNYVCAIRGVSEDDVSVLLMEGAGVPKVTIRAYNRQVDWPQLLAHLKAATSGESIQVGD